MIPRAQMLLYCPKMLMQIVQALGELPREGLDQLGNWVRLVPKRVTSPAHDSEPYSSWLTRDSFPS